MKRRNHRRGATLMEAVIAITIITIVTATALIIVQYAGNFLNRESSRRAMHDAVDDTVELFAYCDNPEEFRQLMALSGDSFLEVNRLGVAEPEGRRTLIFRLEKPLYEVYVTAVFYAGGNSEIVISASLTDKTGESYTFTYATSH